MRETAQIRAVRNYRRRLSRSGMARFEVLAPKSDRHLLRSLARRLAGNGPEAARIREMVRQSIAVGAPKQGNIMTALRRSPLVGAELDLARPITVGRKINL